MQAYSASALTVAVLNVAVPSEPVDFADAAARTEEVTFTGTAPDGVEAPEAGAESPSSSARRSFPWDSMMAYDDEKRPSQRAPRSSNFRKGSHSRELLELCSELGRRKS